MIGIGAHSANEEESDQPTKNDPKRDECSLEMQKLWNSLASELGESVTTLGLCDLETDIFIDLFKQASIPPKNFSVNLKSCCVVPPNLKQFTQENQILLQTHADLPTVLSPEFCEKITQKSAPNWIIRYQLFIKARGVLQDKRYLIQSE